MAFTISLEHKIALVTGISSGIGRGIALELARAGATVIGCGLEPATDSSVQELVAALRQTAPGSAYLSWDLAVPAACSQLVAQVLEQTGGRLDILVSNAGKNSFFGAADTTAEQWQAAIDLNLQSHWMLAQRCRPALAASGSGVIIVLSSNHAWNTLPGCFPYNVAKAGLTALVQSLAIEWGPAIRTVGIAPGFIDTPGNDAWFRSFADPAAKRAEVTASHPVKKLGTPAEIGGWCVFLASSYAAFASGTTYLIDGGRSALMQ